ncbi:MAG: hypothetical protein ABUS57_11125 [Pseudomonadota bacterium]
MKHAVLFGAAIAAAMFVAPAWAQDDEIVVTGARASAFESLAVPHVFMKHRPDSVIVELEVRSDTRDKSQRLDEIRQALRGLDGHASATGVSLALVDDDEGVVRPFTMATAEELITADRRADTSTITISVRTPVSATDTLDTVHARINRFVAQAAKPGRIEMETGDTQLVLNNPEQYREPLLRDVTADGRAVAAALGAGYGVEVSGLERQVAWKRTGYLELTLFVPYSLSVSPSH